VRGDPLATDQSQPTSHRYLAFYHLAPRTLPPPPYEPFASRRTAGLSIGVQ